jgi:hypothetical protein
VDVVLTDDERRAVEWFREEVAQAPYYVPFQNQQRTILAIVDRLDAELRELQPIISDAIGDSCNLTAAERRTARWCIRALVDADKSSYGMDSFRGVLVNVVTDIIRRRFMPEEVTPLPAPPADSEQSASHQNARPPRLVIRSHFSGPVVLVDDVS